MNVWSSQGFEPRSLHTLTNTMHYATKTVLKWINKLSTATLHSLDLITNQTLAKLVYSTNLKFVQYAETKQQTVDFSHLSVKAKGKYTVGHLSNQARFHFNYAIIDLPNTIYANQLYTMILFVTSFK